MRFSKAKYAGEGGIKELLDIALPMIVSTACDGAMTFIDRFFMVKIGPEQMNAVMGGGLTLQTMCFFFTGITSYSTALVARYFGAGERHKSSLAAFQAVLITLFAWPVIIACKPLAVSAFHGMGLTSVQIDFQTKYLNILTIGSVLGMLRYTLGCYFSGIGRTRVVMCATLAAMTVNVALDYILIFGRLGLPAMGIEGAAIATVTGWGCAVSVLVLAYFGQTNREAFSVLSSFHFNRRIMANLIRFGYPVGLEFFLTLLASTLTAGIFHSYGNVTATASTITFNWDLVSFIPLLGIEISVTSLVGRYMGANNISGAVSSAYSGIQTGLLYSLVILILFIFMPKFLVNVFSPDTYSPVFEQAAPIAVQMIRIAAFYVMAQAVAMALIGVLRGAGDTLFTMLASVISNLFLVPVLYAAIEWSGFSVTAGWALLVAGYLVFTLVIAVRFKWGKWKTITIN